MIRRHLQKVALYSLSSVVAERTNDASTHQRKALRGSEKAMDIVVLSRKVGESILVPAQGLTVQVLSINCDQVHLQITVPSETSVFRMGVPLTSRPSEVND